MSDDNPLLAAMLMRARAMQSERVAAKCEEWSIATGEKAKTVTPAPAHCFVETAACIGHGRCACDCFACDDSLGIRQRGIARAESEILLRLAAYLRAHPTL